MVPLGSGQQRFAGVIGHLDDDSQIGKRRSDRLQCRRESGVHHDRGRLGIAEEVREFLGHVPIVDVERSEACLVGTEHALQVLVAVGQIDRHVVLARLVIGELGPFGDGTKTPVDQSVGEASRAIGDIGPGETPITPNQAFAIGIPLGDRFVESRQVDLGHHPVLAPGSTSGEKAKRCVGGVDAVTLGIETLELCVVGRFDGVPLGTGSHAENGTSLGVAQSREIPQIDHLW